MLTFLFWDVNQSALLVSHSGNVSDSGNQHVTMLLRVPIADAPPRLVCNMEIKGELEDSRK